MVLRDSLKTTHPDSDFFIFLADAALEPGGLTAQTIPVEDLRLQTLTSMAFRYTLMEFATAIKPFCFDHLFDELGFDAAIYLDPDIQVFRPLAQIERAFEDGASSVLTPHILSPLEDTANPDDIAILRSGTFNLGFAAFRNVPESRTFLRWWGSKLSSHCYNDLENGLFVDQKFAEFAPSFLSRLHVLRDPGYNVAYWNLAHRPITKAGPDWKAGASALVFFHFSGVVPGNPNIFSKHQDRFDMTNSGAASELVRHYLDLLEANGNSVWRKKPYAYNSFRDGSPISTVFRRSPNLKEEPDAWFNAPDSAFWNAPSERVEQVANRPITRFMLAVHESRPDLRAAFPLSTSAGRRDFHAWFLVNGASEANASESALVAASGRPPGTRLAPRNGALAKSAKWLSVPASFLPRPLVNALKAWFIRTTRYSNK